MDREQGAIVKGGRRNHLVANNLPLGVIPGCLLLFYLQSYPSEALQPQALMESKLSPKLDTSGIT